MPKGKKGVDQRVKGNAKAASSGRMTEFLAGNVAGFVGFEAVSSTLSSDKWSTAEQEQETKQVDLDPASYGATAEFQVVMKQLGKRDTTTKLKALQEFTSLCQRESVESVQNVLTVWSLMYNKLSMDNDHRVREASHKALKSCAECVKASLGPHIRGIFGCWVSGMCDPHNPAAIAAQTAFIAAFPSNKQKNVYMHGFRSILKHVEDMALKETVDTFSDPKVVPEDERVQRYERAVAMSLFGLSLSLSQLSEDFLAESEEGWMPLLSENRLWKLNKHQNPSIRAAIYTLVLSICKSVPSFVKSRAKQFCTLVLGSLGESDPGVVGVVWEAGLIIIATVETWSDHINVQKALLPGLWSLLNAGGYGSARIAYKYLLPLLSKLIDQIFATDVNFAKSFLEKMSSGVEGERVRNMRSDCETVMDTYVDCYLYFLSHVRVGDPEKGAFQEDLAKMVVNLLEYAIVQCPPVPFDAVTSAVVKLVSQVLSRQKDDTSLSFWAMCFQQRFTVRLADVVMCCPSDKEQIQLSRVADIIAKFSTRAVSYNEKAATEGAASCKEKAATEGAASCKEKAATEGAEGQQMFDYLVPVISSLCAICVTKLLSTKSLQHSILLSKALQACTAPVVVALAQRMFPNPEPSLTEASKLQMAVPPDCQPDERACLGLASGLLTTVCVAELPSEDQHYVETVVELVVAIIRIETISISTALKFVENIIHCSPSMMPVLLLKLAKKTEPAHMMALLTNSQEVVLSLMSQKVDQKVPHTWQLVSLILQEPEYELSEKSVVGSVYCKLCQLIKEGLNKLDKNQLDQLFKTMESVSASVVNNNQVVRSQLNDLLVYLLNWSIDALTSYETGQRNDLIRSVVRCFRYLLTVHTSLSLWLKTATEMVIGRGTTDMRKVLFEAVAFVLLHCEALQTLDTFGGAYSSTVASLRHPKVRTLPLLSLELFCSAKLLYTPLPVSEDLLTTSVMDTIPPSFIHVVWPAVALCDATILEGLVNKTAADSESESHWFKAGESSPSILFGNFEREDSTTLWKDLVLIFVQGLGYLRSSHLKEHEHELLMRTIIESALERTLKVGLRHRQWIKSLLSSILERQTAEHLLLLHIFFTEFEHALGTEAHTMSCDHNMETVSLPEVINMVAPGSDGSVLVAMFRSLCNPSLYASQLLSVKQAKPNDLLLTLCCIMLSPKTEAFQQDAVDALKGLSVQYSGSESSLFESIQSSSSNQLSLLTLLLIREVLAVELIPTEAWDFVLCTLVSLCQLLMEDPGEATTVNMAVFQCIVMDIAFLTSQYFRTPSPRLDLHTEWREFFQPALQGSLLPMFLQCAVSSPGKDFGLMHQRYNISKAAVALCENTENVSLEELVQILLSDFYPFQCAACILAKRYLEAAEISASDEESVSRSQKVSLKVTFIKTVLGAALEKIDLEHVFLEDSHDTSCAKAGTTSYLFLWYLILQSMGRCSPEARALLSEWLKELTLFDHLLHGLFNYLSDSTIVTVKDEMIEVSFSPAMETLACCVYVAVAKQLPFMLRQWHNSLDRQTSAMVSRFTSRVVSPALQQAELERKYNSVDGNMETRVCAGASEVSVTYRVDECCIELWVSLPESYPLQPPSIREGKRVRIDLAQWRKWMLQLNVFVANQNGSLWDGLALWKSNLDKHFAGVEDCMICFSVIHASNYSLPKMSCRTCKKRFHNACLYKWFSSSNNSSCPLCRNIF